MSVLYFSNWQITTQDVLDEIALAISISGCPIHCKGCHSAFTWNPIYGEELTNEKLKNLILKNKYISCVLFYGGEWQLDRLIEMIEIVKAFNLKVCLYTGLILEEIKQTKVELLNILDYIKVGRFIEKKGGLSKETTNQRFYKIIHNDEKISDNQYDVLIVNNVKLIDWTKRFFKKIF